MDLQGAKEVTNCDSPPIAYYRKKAHTLRLVDPIAQAFFGGWRSQGRLEQEMLENFTAFTPDMYRHGHRHH